MVAKTPYSEVLEGQWLTPMPVKILKKIRRLIKECEFKIATKAFLVIKLEIFLENTRVLYLSYSIRYLLSIRIALSL